MFADFEVTLPVFTLHSPPRGSQDTRASERAERVAKKAGAYDSHSVSVWGFRVYKPKPRKPEGQLSENQLAL